MDFESSNKQIRLPKKAERVKNKAPAPVQITAEQLLREAKERELEIVPRAPRARVHDPEEAAEQARIKRKEFEDNIRKNRKQIANWIKYGKWEESIGELQRARSVFERALAEECRNITIWLQYAEMEMRNKQINHARNVWDRAVQLLPRATQFWLKYTYMEELVENIPGARQVFERWMEWEPNEQAWQTYINFELRYNETDRARDIFQRFLHVHGDDFKNWIRYARFEEKNGFVGNARAVFEQAVEYFGDDFLDEQLLVQFAKFEERQKEVERARAIYQYGLDRLPKSKSKSIFDSLAVHEKKYGERVRIENVIILKRKQKYEDTLAENSYDYDTWFDYINLMTSEELPREEVEDTFERAIANIPPYEEKRYWRRYIYLWIYYAIYEELDVQDPEKAREVYKACLEVIPHRKFTFAKIWILFAKFEIRQKNLVQARKILGNAIGKCPKKKLFREYIDLELRFREFDRCRMLYEKYVLFMPEHSMTWIKFAELENALGDADRARAIFSMAIEQQALDMPEVLWKAYIDFEIEQEDYDKVRALYKILLERTNHIKVWISWIEFEIKVENFDKARETFKVANDALQKSTAEERILLLEKWLEFERQNGTPEQVKVVEDQVPKRIKRRRQILAEDGTDAGWEEYYDYIFPKDQTSAVSSKLLEAAHKWKESKAVQKENAVPVDRDVEPSKEDENEDADTDMTAPSEPAKTKKKNANSEDQENENAALIEKLKQKGVVNRQQAFKNRPQNKKGVKRSHPNPDPKGNKKKSKTVLDILSKKIVDAFYYLTNVTGNNDIDPINTIVNAKLNSEEESYVLKRCVAALASGNRAARIANATVLCYRLQNLKEKLSLDEIEKIAEEKLPIKDSDGQLKSNILGRGFLYYSLIQSGKYGSKEELHTILKNLKKYSESSLNKFIYAEILSSAANILGKVFYSNEFSEINSIPKEAKGLKDLKPWELMVLLKLKTPPPGSLGKLFEGGKLNIKKEDYGTLKGFLKSTDNNYDKYSLGGGIVAVSLNSKNSKIFSNFLATVFDEKFNEESSEDEDLNALLSFIQYLFREEIVPINNIVEVLDMEKVLKKLINISNYQYGIRIVNNFFESLVELLESQNPSNEVFVKFFDFLYKNGLKNIDEKYKTQWIKKIIGALSLERVMEFSKYIFENKDDFLSEKVLQLQKEKNLKIPCETWIDLIQMIKKEKIKLLNKALNVGVFVTRRKKILTFMQNDVNAVIKKFLKKYGNIKFEFKEKNLCMQRVYGVIKILEVLSEDEFYHTTSEELKERLKNDDFDSEVIIDLCLSFISRKESTLKYLAFIMINEYVNQFTIEDFQILLNVDGKNVPENFIVAARRALGKAAVVGDEDDDVEMDDEELAEMDKRLADVFQVFTSHSKKMRKFQIAHFRMDVAQLVGLLLLKANSEQRPKLEPHFREFAKESKESGNQDLSKPIREIMSNSIPPEVLAVLNEFNEGLKQLKNATKEFMSVPFEEMQTHPPLAQAEVNSATMYAVNGLTAIDMELQGKNPHEDNDLELEIRRQKRLAERISVARDTTLRPKLNQFAVSAFIRNALFDVNDTSRVDQEWSQVNEDGSVVDGERIHNEDINATIEQDKVMAQIQKNPGYFVPFKRPLPFDPYLVPDYFPRVPEGDDTAITQAITTRNNALMPTAAEQASINQMVSKVNQILESIISNPKKVPNVEIQEIKEVGSYKKGTMLTKSNSADLVVILRTLPTVELVMNLGQKIVDELKADLKEIFGCVSRPYGCEIAGTQAIVKLHITILPPNIPLLEPDLHMPVNTLQENMAMIRHARWFEENGTQSTLKVMIRVLKDIKKRTEGWKNFSIWHIELLSHYSLYHTPNRQPLPLSHGFKRFLQLLSAGILLPGSPSLNDPCNRGIPLTMTYDEKDMDSICTAAQTMLRVLCHGGINSILGCDPKIQDVTTEVSVWDVNVVVTPLEKAYGIDVDEENDEGKVDAGHIDML